MLAGVIVALGSYMFRHYVVGYENYIAATVKLLQDYLSQTEVPSKAREASCKADFGKYR